jgi:hypothetical protein
MSELPYISWIFLILILAAYYRYISAIVALTLLLLPDLLSTCLILLPDRRLSPISIFHSIVRTGRAFLLRQYPYPARSCSRCPHSLWLALKPPPLASCLSSHERFFFLPFGSENGVTVDAEITVVPVYGRWAK